MVTVGREKEMYRRHLEAQALPPSRILRELRALDCLETFLHDRHIEDLRSVVREHVEAFGRAHPRHLRPATEFLGHLVASYKLFALPMATAIVPITNRVRPRHAEPFPLQEPPKGGLRFRDFVRKYRETVWELQMKPSSLRDYDSLLGRHLLPYFGDSTVEGIGAEQAAAFAAHLKKQNLSNKRTNNALVALKTLLRAAYEWGYLKTPVHIRALPRDDETREMAPLSELEIARALAEIPASHRALFQTAFLTGMRWGELQALRWDDVDLDGRMIWVRRAWSAKKLSTTKTRKQRRIEMQPALCEVLRVHPRRSSWIFVTDDGTPHDTDNLRNRVWAPALERAGLRYRAMVNTRHTYASVMLQKGNPLAYVSAQLGHSTPHTTLTYYVKYIPSQGGITPIDMDARASPRS